jgi:DNA-binding winged helix-turn-helix (wHTH) protein/TolB-like protein
MTDPSRVRFGVFDFDPASGELLREGVPVRLQRQPARVLAILVARAGEAVTRETLRQALWGPVTFVDFDRGLNFCVAQIRAALGDSADAPRFIRTLPKRGYQFIAPVSDMHAANGTIVVNRTGPATAANAGPAKEFAGSAAAPPGMAAQPVDSSKALARSPAPGATGAILAVALLAAAIAPAAWWAMTRAAPAAPTSTLIAVALFDADRRVPEAERFAQGLTDAVIAELTTKGEGRFGVIGNAAILRTARTVRDLDVIAAALKVRYVVVGSVEREGNRMRVLAHLIRLPEQTHLSVARLDRGIDDPLAAELELAQEIVAKFSPRVAADAVRRTARRRQTPPAGGGRPGAGQVRVDQAVTMSGAPCVMISVCS